MLSQLQLDAGKPRNYAYLKNAAETAGMIDDRTEFEAMNSAFSDLGFDVFCIFEISILVGMGPSGFIVILIFIATRFQPECFVLTNFGSVEVLQT